VLREERKERTDHRPTPFQSPRRGREKREVKKKRTEEARKVTEEKGAHEQKLDRVPGSKYQERPPPAGTGSAVTQSAEHRGIRVRRRVSNKISQFSAWSLADTAPGSSSNKDGRLEVLGIRFSDGISSLGCKAIPGHQLCPAGQGSTPGILLDHPTNQLT